MLYAETGSKQSTFPQNSEQVLSTSCWEDDLVMESMLLFDVGLLNSNWAADVIAYARQDRAVMQSVHHVRNSKILIITIAVIQRRLFRSRLSNCTAVLQRFRDLTVNRLIYQVCISFSSESCMKSGHTTRGISCPIWWRLSCVRKKGVFHRLSFGHGPSARLINRLTVLNTTVQHATIIKNKSKHLPLQNGNVLQGAIRSVLSKMKYFWKHQGRFGVQPELVFRPKSNGMRQ